MAQDVAHSLTALVRSLRPEWDTNGVFVIVLSCIAQHGEQRTITGAIAAAYEPNARTPAIIRLKTQREAAPDSGQPKRNDAQRVLDERREFMRQYDTDPEFKKRIDQARADTVAQARALAARHSFDVIDGGKAS